MHELDAMKYRYFFLAFSVAFLVLTLLLLFMVTMVPPRPTGAAAQAELLDYTADSGYVPEGSDALNVLFIGSRGGQEAERFLLARFDPARNSVPLMALPAHLAVTNRGVEETLTEVYRYGGADYTRDTLGDSLGVDIHRYVRMDEAAFIACAAAVGTVEYTLDRDVPINGAGAQMVLQAGVQLLDGQKVAGLLQSPAYDSHLERSALLGELTAEIVNQRIDICESALLDKVFATIINLVDTDISNMDFQQRRQAGEYLAGLEEGPAISIRASGEEREGRYHLSDTVLALLRQTFS